MRHSPLARPAGALACCLLLATALVAPSAANAAMTQTYSAGPWAAFSGTDEANKPVCAMATNGAEGRRIAIQQNTGEPGLHLLLDKASWSIPEGTPIDVAVQIDRNATMALRGTGKGNQVDVDLPFDQAVPLMRQVRAGTQIRVFFPAGTEAMWSGGLSGTTAVMQAFNDCRATMAPAASGPSQPYQPAPNAPAPTPTQPYPPAPTPAPAPAPAPAPHR